MYDVHAPDQARGWTPKSIAEIAIPAMVNDFYTLERSPEVIGWEPI